MPLTKLQAEGLNLADTFAFSGTVSGAGGGKVAQVLQAVKTDRQGTTNQNNWSDVSGLSQAITPSATSSKILLHFCVNTCATVNSHSAIKILRGSTDIFVGDADASNVRLFSGWRTVSDSQYHAQVLSGSFLDSPNTTSATTYKIQIQGDQTVYVNRPVADDDQSTVQRTRGSSSLTVMEILA
ncbi:uncharacterized protein [uncultured Mediterranean phage uvMED]|nr:uncharacterized protein [uncultured Mediterranean phage uvMED]|tara:strand:- start:243 stop:791 length:549 start_codon:yes stop_codon:yes gene_type:complete